MACYKFAKLETALLNILLGDNTEIFEVTFSTKKVIFIFIGKNIQEKLNNLVFQLLSMANSKSKGQRKTFLRQLNSPFVVLLDSAPV